MSIVELKYEEGRHKRPFDPLIINMDKLVGARISESIGFTESGAALSFSFSGMAAGSVSYAFSQRADAETILEQLGQTEGFILLEGHLFRPVDVLAVFTSENRMEGKQILKVELVSPWHDRLNNFTLEYDSEEERQKILERLLESMHKAET